MTDAIFRLGGDAKPKTNDLLEIGTGEVAYIRPVRLMNRQLFSVHAADGTPISVVESEHLARDILEKNDLEQARIH